MSHSHPRALRHPALTHHAAARRWIAAARESLRRAAAGADSAPYWLMCACEDLLRADGHRSLARKWRVDPRLEATALRPLAKARSVAPPARDDQEPAAEGASFAAAAARIEAYFLAARQALRLARTYASETGSSGRRERECIAQAQRYRQAIRELRSATPPSSRPSLAKSRVERTESSRRTG